MPPSEPNPSDQIPAEEWTFHPGDVISGRYEIVDHLGQGAFGEVHAARDTETGRQVALKILRTDSVERDPKAVARMRQEAEILRALDHPNLVKVFDIGSVDGHEYLVMELLEGRSLAELIEDGDLATPDRLRPLVAQILSALDAMHGREVQHRDIKPDNIVLLDQDGAGEIAKLVDFGIAKAQDFLDGDHEHTLVETQEDEFVGTPRYAAPEQAVGDPVDAGADLFSLGMVAAEWLTGRPRLDESGDRGAISILIKPEPIDVSDCPAEWQPWLVRMCAKKPEERYGTAAEALEELPGLQAPGDWLRHPEEQTQVEGSEDPTAPLQRNRGSDPNVDRAEPATQIGEPGDPLEPTEVSSGPEPQPTPADDRPVADRPPDEADQQMETLETSPTSGPDPPDRPAGPPDRPAGRSTALSNDQPTEPAGTTPQRRAAPPQQDLETADRDRRRVEDDLDDSTLFWTVAAAAFFVSSLILFLYTLLTS